MVRKQSIIFEFCTLSEISGVLQIVISVPYYFYMEARILGYRSTVLMVRSKFLVQYDHMTWRAMTAAFSLAIFREDTLLIVIIVKTYFVLKISGISEE